MSQRHFQVSAGDHADHFGSLHDRATAVPPLKKQIKCFGCDGISRHGPYRSRGGLQGSERRRQRRTEQLQDILLNLDKSPLLDVSRHRLRMPFDPQGRQQLPQIQIIRLCTGGEIQGVMYGNQGDHHLCIIKHQKVLQ